MDQGTPTSHQVQATQAPSMATSRGAVVTQAQAMTPSPQASILHHRVLLSPAGCLDPFLLPCLAENLQLVHIWHTPLGGQQSSAILQSVILSLHTPYAFCDCVSKALRYSLHMTTG